MPFQARQEDRLTRSQDGTIGYFDGLRRSMSVEDVTARLAPKPPELQEIRTLARVSPENAERIWSRLERAEVSNPEIRRILADEDVIARIGDYAGNIESAFGEARMPLGIAGPLRVNGLHAQGEYFVPLATSEAALVASYHRGMRAATEAGGISSSVVSHGVMRSPVFKFPDEVRAGIFIEWAMRNIAVLRDAAEATTRHGRLIEIAPHIENEVVFLVCRYSTGDAAGQNMCTIATQALCEVLLEQVPVKPEYWFVEGNFSGDKKASALAFLGGRGRKVTASVTMDDDVVRRKLRTEIRDMERYVRMSSLGGILSGTMGVQGHYANALAALFIATGQDAACVAECATGITKIDCSEGQMRFSVTMPSLLVGTVGGGTGMPTAAACLDLMGLHGTGKANAFAEVVAATCLAGELSIIAALSSGQFTRAHGKLARTRLQEDAQ